MRGRAKSPRWSRCDVQHTPRTPARLPPHPASARSCPQRPRPVHSRAAGASAVDVPAARSEHGRETNGRPPGRATQRPADGGRAGIDRPVARRRARAGDRDAVRGFARRGAGGAHRRHRRTGPRRRAPLRRALPRRAPLHTPGRCGRSRRSRWRSGSRRTASARATAAWIWLRRRAPPCSPPPRAPWCSPGLWRAAAWCRSSTRTACGPPTNRWPRSSRGGRRSRREPCWARSSPVTGRAGRPACTGACGASGATTSTRSCCSCRGTCGCCRCPARSQRESSASRTRSRATSRPCSWLTRDSVTPSIRPISARVRSSR